MGEVRIARNASCRISSPARYLISSQCFCRTCPKVVEKYVVFSMVFEGPFDRGEMVRMVEPVKVTDWTESFYEFMTECVHIRQGFGKTNR